MRWFGQDGRVPLPPVLPYLRHEGIGDGCTNSLGFSRSFWTQSTNQALRGEGVITGRNFSILKNHSAFHTAPGMLGIHYFFQSLRADLSDLL